MGRRTEERMSPRSRVVNTRAVLIEASYEIPERNLLIIVICHVVLFCNDSSMCLGEYILLVERRKCVNWKEKK